jgi:hypothetical protein
MPRRPSRRFEVIKAKLPLRPRRSIPGGRWRSGPHRTGRKVADRPRDFELDAADDREDLPEPGEE